MKRTFYIIALLCLAITANAQTESSQVLSFLQKAMNFNKSVPQEKVYMHFDNTGYFENETMWFKAYITRADKQTKTNLSKILYVELLNPSGDVIKTQKYPIKENGTSYGEMKLDTLLGSGFYEVRAYTRYMTNWGVNACFSRVFPVFDKPKTEGDYSNLTIRKMLHKQRNPNNRDGSEPIYTKATQEGVFSNTEIIKTISAQFFPEGGDLVKGIKSRVAMMAVTDDGSPYRGEAIVKNEKGEVVANVKTDSLGRGIFTVTPDGGKLMMDMKNAKSKNQTFELPAAKDEGCVLNLDIIEENPLVTIQSSEKVCNRLLGFVVMNNGNILYCDTARAVPLLEVELSREQLAEGVNQFTLFDSNGRIMAERLFFICPKQNPEDIITVTSTNKFLKPCGLTEIQFQTLPNSSLSFTAIDPGSMTNGKQGNIKTWMLLSSEVRGYINNVDYYFEADDEEHRKSADLLMMTQGWRRYDWNLMSGIKKFDKIQPIEDQFYIYGKLHEYRKRNKAGNVTLNVFLYNSKGESLNGTTTTKEDGSYAFALPSMDGEWKMQMHTSIDDKMKTFYVGIDRNFSPTPRFITPTETAMTLPLKPNAFVRNADDPLTEEEEYIPITEKDHVLDNITVKAKRRFFTNDDWKYKNESYGKQYATLYYDIDKELDAYRDEGKEDPTVFELLCKLNSLFVCPDAKSLPYPPMDDDSLWQGKLSYGGRPIKWIVNNGETNVAMNITDDSQSKTFKAVSLILGKRPNLTEMTNGEMFCAVTSEAGATGDNFFPIWPSEVKNVYIVPYSPKEEDQAVRIYLYTHTKFSTASTKGIRHTHFQGFNTPTTFKTEDYSVLPPMADFRRTIFWEPNIDTDDKGKATIKFYNNSLAKEMYISVEGMSENGTLISNK